MFYRITADGDWQCDLRSSCHGVFGGQTNLELRKIIMFRQIRNGNTTMISELAKGVGDMSSSHKQRNLQRKITGSPIHDSRFYGRDFNRNQQNLDQDAFCSETFGVVGDAYVR
jgi:hypothetical protein